MLSYSGIRKIVLIKCLDHHIRFHSTTSSCHFHIVQTLSLSRTHEIAAPTPLLSFNFLPIALIS